MKLFLPVLFCFFLFLAPSVHAQQEYIVDGEVHFLKTEVKGELELLWSKTNRRYRFFLKKGDYITELKNRRIEGSFKPEFIQVLETQTADAKVSTKRVSLTLLSLHNFFAEYNSLKDPLFTDEKKDVRLQLWLGIYGGITNTIYTANVTNESQYVGGLELELVDPIKLKRHSMVLDFRHTFEGSEHKYSSSQLGLNYRFKFIKTSRLDFYLNTKVATLTYFEKEVSYNEGVDFAMESGSSYGSPISFGVGADIKVGKGYIALGYHDFFALNMENVNSEFPIDYSLGYKFCM